jgi:predicted RNA-binding Zn ribbon-like protein
MQPVFVGSHSALDFLNTSFSPEGERVETIGSGRTFLDWLVRAELLDAAMASKLSARSSAKALDAAASEARKLREWARAWLTRWRAAPGDDYQEEIATLNKLLRRTTLHREVVAEKRGIVLVEQVRLESADALVGVVALQIAQLIAQDDASLVRQCAGAHCTLWFLDRTKAHRRLFCSAAACGNRAKVAAFRERQRR